MNATINNKQILNKIARLIYRDKKRIIIALVVSIASYYFTLYPTDRLSYIVDGIASGNIDFNGVVNEILRIILAGIALYIVYFFKEYYTFIGYDKIIKDMTYDIQHDIYGHTPVFFNKFSIGEVISRSTNDITNYIAPLFGYGILLIFDGIIYNLFISILIFNKSNFIYLLLIHIPLVIQTIYLVSRRKVQEKYYNKMAKTMDEITEETLENVKGIRVIRAYSLLDKVRNSFVGKLRSYARSNEEYMKKTLVYQPLNTVSLATSYIIAVACGFYFINLGMMTLGKLISVCVVIGMIQWPYIALSELVIMIIEVRQATKRVLEISDKKADVNNDLAKSNFEFNSSIEFKEFNFSYEDNNHVLEDINFTINKGETIGVVGKTGSGKTTFIKQLLRLYPIEENTLLLDGKGIEQYYDYSVREKIGYAPQEYQLFSKSIKENVLFYRYDLEDRLDEVLEQADIKKDIIRFKDGIDTLVGENGLSLSGGQKQRLGIARALLSNPEILILDDSLSAVDSNTEKTIIENIKKTREGKTNIIVAHRISAVRHADKIVVLDNGKILNSGTHEELLECCSWYKQLDDYQNKEVEDDEE
ncbi:ABC transporter ATP-binding protein [Gemella haemolysans]|uniref:ABC transporter ATP-binding protein n=1 Tax=Gemella haemolysans TaxID=1379 RepID=A0AAW6B371_9BACL|nr:ABC transporter ATP-binding protein [Gemella haemolysans]MDB6186602.1 ABC transporter ATP-binding protein [Gemella haemolysans]MDB6213232.1 ABC transporter ATP-binding protein [Gemella haemolysans]